MNKKIALEMHEEIALIKLIDTKNLNIITRTTVNELSNILDIIEKNDKLKCVILYGEGRAFCAGADIKEHYTFDCKQAYEFGISGSKTLRRMELLNVPTIAAIRGATLGGGLEIALSCEIIIASSNSMLGLPEVKLGLIPGFSGTQRLPRRIGLSKAKEMLYTGEIIDSEKAMNLGIVNKVVNDEELLDEAMSMAKKISENSKEAIEKCKKVMDYGFEVEIDRGIEFEIKNYADCFNYQWSKERMLAFIEKKNKK